MAGPVIQKPPVTWVTALAGVRDLVPPLPPPKKPPDPSESPTDGEGEAAMDEQDAEEVNQLKPLECNPVEPLKAEDLAEWDEIEVCQVCNPDQAIVEEEQTLNKWDDFDNHADKWRCCLSKWIPSFGPLGLLAAAIDELIALVDTGASVTITPHREDFIEYEEVSGNKVLKGLTAGASIIGRGIVHWKLEVGGKTVDLKLRALHVPSAEQRLLCPQQLRKEHRPKVKRCSIEDESIQIEFEEGVVDCPYNDSNLPVLKIAIPSEMNTNLSAMNACVTMENNQNLSVAHKELLKWHCRLGHMGFPCIQNLMKTGALGNNPRIKAAAGLNLSERPLICASCAYGKAKRLATRRKKRTKAEQEPAEEKVLSKDVLIPGQKVSMDHFIVSTPGRLFNSRGSESHDRMFKGGVIFVDHASGFVFVEPVVNFTAGEAIRAKREFEREMASMGVTVLNYHTDNGVFTAAAFQDELASMEQGLSLSGVGAHHQNAMAERAIGTVVSISRTMMLHAKMRWPKAVTTKLWPMAMKHAQFLINHVPNMNNVCPMDLVLKTMTPRHVLRNAHVWGAPCYVLDPKLQDGHKIPKFDPRSRQALHLGWSPKHASSVPLVLNLSTGKVSPQFHVVFDDWFTTVSSKDDNGEEPIDGEAWTDLLMSQRFQVMFDEQEPLEVDEEWLTELERIEKHERAVARVQGRMPQLDPVAEEQQEPPRTNPQDAPSQRQTQQEKALTPQREAAPQREPMPALEEQQAPLREAAPEREPERKERAPLSTRVLRKREAGIYEKDYWRKKEGVQVRQKKTNLVAKLALLLAACNQPILAMAKASIGSPAAHVAMAGYDAVTETFDCVDWFTYKAMTTPVKGKRKKGVDPLFPTYQQAMSGPDADEWKASMRKELDTLKEMNTWTIVPHAEALAKGKRVIKTTWAFRQKVDPMGNHTKKKSRFCVRGDTMLKDVDYFESYSPVMQWSSVRLMLILSIVYGLET